MKWPLPLAIACALSSITPAHSEISSLTDANLWNQIAGIFQPPTATETETPTTDIPHRHGSRRHVMRHHTHSRHSRPTLPARSITPVIVPTPLERPKSTETQTFGQMWADRGMDDLELSPHPFLFLSLSPKPVHTIVYRP
jgi:hypothetical protein